MRRSASAMLAVVLVLGLAGPASADPGKDSPTIMADLSGTPIEVDAIPSYFCHDRDYPRIHCFATAAGRELAMAQDTSVDALAGTTATNYVIVYASTSYTGASMYVSQNYDTLVTVGWNDRIRSYKGLNSSHGVFWTDWFATGASLSFCCNVLDPSLPSTFDLTITSVYRQ